jgi:hypothetical protein
MFFDTAYDTLVGARNHTQIADALKLAHIATPLATLAFTNKQSGQSHTLGLIRGGTPAEDRIPYLVHPFEHYDPSRGVSQIYVDLRNYGVMDQRQNQFTLRNKAETRFLLTRAMLESSWSNDGAGYLRDLSLLPVAGFSKMISQIVTHRFNLNPGDQVMLSIYAAYYYYCLFEDAPQGGEEFVQRVAGKIARACNLDAGTVMQHIGELGSIEGLGDFCERLPGFLSSVQLRTFDTGTLLQIITGSWYGTNAREIMGVALEHPPTWLAICYSALNDSVFTRAGAAMILQRLDRAGEGTRFSKGLEDVIDLSAIDQYVA